MPARTQKPVIKGDALTFERLKDDYLFCRTVGHRWFEIVRDDLARPTFGWRFSVECEGCHTIRDQIVNPNTGDTESAHYTYPDGYRLDEKATRSEIRMEWGQRRNYDFIGAQREKRAAKKTKRSAA